MTEFGGDPIDVAVEATVAAYAVAAAVAGRGLGGGAWRLGAAGVSTSVVVVDSRDASLLWPKGKVIWKIN